MFTQMKSIALWLLFSLGVFCQQPQNLTSIPTDPADIGMPGHSLQKIRYSHYTRPQRPIDSVLNFIQHAQDDLHAQRIQRHAGWFDDIPGGSFTYQDENSIRFEIHTNPRVWGVYYDFVECLLQGMKIWTKRWSEGSLGVPCTDISILNNGTLNPFVSANLRYGLNSEHLLPLNNASLSHIRRNLRS